jgi:hypothetical protein
VHKSDGRKRVVQQNTQEFPPGVSGPADNTDIKFGHGCMRKMMADRRAKKSFASPSAPRLFFESGYLVTLLLIITVPASF